MISSPSLEVPSAFIVREPHPLQLAPDAQKLRIVIVGHVDHGKSTLIGRLFYDTHSLPDGTVEALRNASKAEGMEFEFAFLLDALLEEQEQNITIDTTRLPFRTKNREYVIIDAPGHKEFLKNMITGAASADAAILLIDALEGIQEQSRRHAFLLSLLGIKQVIIAVNKMDLVAFEKARFEQIRCEILELLSQMDVDLRYVIPVSAKQGQNVICSSPHMSWYQGPSLVEALESFILPSSPVEGPLRLMIQDVYRFDHRRILVGKIESGCLRQGEEIYFWPNGKCSRIRSIEEWNGGELISVSAGKSVAITLEEQIFVERGQIATHAHEAPAVHREIIASLFWLHEEPLLLNKPFILKLGTQSTEARLVEITHLVDSSTLQSVSRQPTQIAKNQVAEVRIHTKRLLAFDRHDRIHTTGRFVILTGKRIGGGGIIRQIETPENPLHTPISNHIVWSSSRVSRTARLEQYGHRGAILWMTGLSASGKSSLASQLEWHLHRRGMATFMLDGDNLRHGLSSDLGFSPSDRKENIRRAGEAAKLLAEAGLVVICSFISPYREDRRLLRESCAREGIAFAEIYVNVPLAICEERDPKGLYKKARAGEIPDFTGVSAPYEPPPNPELELRTAEQSWEECMTLLFEFTESFAAPPVSFRSMALFSRRV